MIYRLSVLWLYQAVAYCIMFGTAGVGVKGVLDVLGKSLAAAPDILLTCLLVCLVVFPHRITASLHVSA